MTSGTVELQLHHHKVSTAGRNRRPSGSKQPCPRVVSVDVSKLSLAETSESTSLQPLRLEVQTPNLDSIGQKMLPRYFYLFSGLMSAILLPLWMAIRRHEVASAQIYDTHAMLCLLGKLRPCILRVIEFDHRNRVLSAA